MAFRDHLEQAVSISTINPINDMRLSIEEHPNSPIIFENVDGAPGHRAAANVCLRANMAKNFGIEPSELQDAMEIAMNTVDVVVTGGIIVWWVLPPMLFAGFITPLPYNYYRLKKYNLECH